jgi:hypothetical protein
VKVIFVTCALLQTADQFFAFKVPMRTSELNGLCRGIDKAFQIYTQLAIGPIGLHHHLYISPKVPFCLSSCCMLFIYLFLHLCFLSIDLKGKYYLAVEIKYKSIL